MKIDGKNIWITGASGGLGRAMAVEVSAKCHALVLSGRKPEELETTKSLCHRSCQIRIAPFDISDLSAHATVVDRVLTEFGKLDIIVHNAGISQRSHVIETNIDVYEKLMRINYLGPIHLTKCLLPHFIDSSSGQMVVISSLVGKFGSPYRSGYAAAKHALHGFFDSLRLEVETHGIEITVICPGFIRTDVSKNALGSRGQKHGVMDERTDAGMTPEAFAQKAIRAINKGKREAYIGKSEIMAVYLRRWWPVLFHQILRRSKVR